MKPSPLTRRSFLHTTGLVLAATSLPFARKAFAKTPELRIKRILVQDAPGRRLSPVAPNAYAPYRGYDVGEPVLRIQTEQGIEGIGKMSVEPATLKALIGLDPFQLFLFGENDLIIGPSEEYKALLAELGGTDIALIDLIGKALKKSAAALLGKNVRESVQAYDGSLYMEDLLKPEEQKDLVFMKGATAQDPIELVVRKAEWVVNDRAEGFKAIKIKIGRSKWMASPEEALARDIAATNAIRKAIGPDIKLLVDGNLDYKKRPMMAFEYAQGVADSNVYFMEEMFPEGDLPNLREFKKRLYASGSKVKLAAGESHIGGIPEKIYTERFEGGPLIEIEQADMNAHGFLFIRSKAAIQAKLGMTFAPHNFGSKLGFFAQVNIGMVTPNWEISEVDDAQLPALVSEGIELKDGFAKLTGAPGLGITLREDKLSPPSVEI